MQLDPLHLLSNSNWPASTHQWKHIRSILLTRNEMLTRQAFSVSNRQHIYMWKSRCSHNMSFSPPCTTCSRQLLSSQNHQACSRCNFFGMASHLATLLPVHALESETHWLLLTNWPFPRIKNRQWDFKLEMECLCASSCCFICCASSGSNWRLSKLICSAVVWPDE